MQLKTGLLCAAALAFAALTSETDAHSWIVKPQSRDTKPTEDDTGNIDCPSKQVGHVTTVKPGQDLPVRYWRNNHIGGFIRWSIVKRGGESKQAFDSNVFLYTCRESGPECLPKGGENKRYTPDNDGDNTIPCGDTIRIPDYLPAGNYVVQWTWMSAGSSYGHRGWANPVYRSCMDITISGSGSAAKPKCPAFVGGDRVTKLEHKGNDVCLYFYTNDIDPTVFKEDDDKKAEQYYKYGMPAQVQKCGGGATHTNATTSPVDPGNATVQPGPGDSDVDSEGGSEGGSDDGSEGGSENGSDNNNSGGGGGNKGEWEFCSSNDECKNQCCSDKYSNDGKMKCTPGGC